MGAKIEALHLITLVNTLFAPMSDRIPVIFLGGGYDDNVAILCLLARSTNVPIDHTQPNIMAVLGVITVLEAERLRLHFCNVSITRCQFRTH